MTKTDAKTRPAKSRWSWSIGLMLVCGAILVALPWLLTRSNWDKSWAKSAVVPLWKVQASRAGIAPLAFRDDTIICPDAAGLQTRQARDGKMSARWPQLSGYGITFSRDGETAMRLRAGTVFGNLTHYWWRHSDGSFSRASQPNTTRVASKQPLYHGRGVEIWNVAAKRLLRVIPIRDDKPNQTTSLSDTVLSPSGRRLFLRLSQGDQVWDTISGQLLWTRKKSKYFDFDPYDTFSSDDKTLYEVSSLDEQAHKVFNELRLIDKRTRHIANTFSVDEKGPPERAWGSWIFWLPVAFSPNGQRLVAIRRSTQSGYIPNTTAGTLYCWDARTRKLLWTFQRENFNPTEIAFSADGQILAVGGADQSILGSFSVKGGLFLLKMGDGQIVSNLTEESPRDRFQQLKMQKEQQLALRVGTYKSPRVEPYLPGDSGPVTSLAFSPDSSKLAAGYGNGEIKKWRVP